MLGFSQLVGGVSNLTRFVENTGSMVFSSGLDTLELIGKKTYTALQQSDPGLKKTKAVLSNPVQGTNDLPSLSQVNYPIFKHTTPNYSSFVINCYISGTKRCKRAKCD